MTHYIGQVEDKYFVYSTVTDTPLTPLVSLAELTTKYREPVTPERISRLQEKGVSAIDYDNLHDLVINNRWGINEATLSFEEFVEKLKTYK